MDDPGNDLFDERDPLDRLLSLLGPQLDELRSLLDDATAPLARRRGPRRRGDPAAAQRRSSTSSA